MKSFEMLKPIAFLSSSVNFSIIYKIICKCKELLLSTKIYRIDRSH